MLKAGAADRMHTRATRWLRGALSHRVAGDAGRLPIADDSIDLVFSNLMLHWHPEPHAVVSRVEAGAQNRRLADV
jgi:malonyl-CoA O-methyltransferase